MVLELVHVSRAFWLVVGVQKTDRKPEIRHGILAGRAVVRFIYTTVCLSLFPVFYPAVAPYWFWWLPLWPAAYWALAGLALDVVSMLERARGVFPGRKGWRRI